MSPEAPGRVVVLLATWNAARFVEEQVDSVLAQQGVQVRLVVSDDASDDGTPAILARLAARHPGRVKLLPAAPRRFGNANRHFLRLIADADVADGEHVAFCDHDDVWLPWKLERAVQVIRADALHAFSSDVTAFWPDGRERLVRKSGAQRAHDHLFESAGPGCTFVLAPAAFAEVRAWLDSHREAARDAKVHDWLIYAYARTHGWRWRIDDRPSMRYRQHAANEVGANSGWAALKARWRNVASGAYRHDVLTIARLIGDRSWVTQALARLRPLDRLRLAVSVRQLRRSGRDQLALALFVLVMPGGERASGAGR